MFLQCNTIMIIILLFLCTLHLPALPVLPEPDPALVLTPTQSLHLPPPSPLPTIPAFPEQSETSGCPLDLPDDLFHGIKTACGSKPHHLPDPNSYSGRIHKNRCCPVLAAYLYSAYSKTALRTIAKQPKHQPQPYPIDMPVLPDDSETCVDTLEKALANRGVQLSKVNETCDVVYCYCGIRLKPFTCPQAFSVNSKGKVIGNNAVKKLESDCVNNRKGGCSNCLNSLHLLNHEEEEEEEDHKGVKSSNRSDRVRTRDCELMGVTWLLNKDRSGYMNTVAAVLRAIMMMSKDDDDSVAEFCRLDSDGMPLAVDSSEIDDDRSSSSIRGIMMQQEDLLPLLFILFFFTVLLLISS